MSRGSARLRDTSRDSAHELFDIERDPLYFEREARASGFCRIAGLDEAGRGPLAGPVVAAAVMLPPDVTIPGVNDSKQVPEAERDRLYDIILEQSVSHGIGIVDERTIDEVNIYQATIIAMRKALHPIDPPPDYLLIDAMTLPEVAIPQKPLVRGDARSHTIAAASIIAKVTRDRIMRDLHEKFPEYNFKKHKGYGTKEHLSLILKHGPCEAHRRSFQPISEMLKGKNR